MEILFIINCVLLGIGLAMDAFSVSMANGLQEPEMSSGKEGTVAGTFAFFQFAMPLLGWLGVHTILNYFRAFQKLIPWIALGLLLFIGGKILREGLQGTEEEPDAGLGGGELLLQGIATSIDALSVGFTIADYTAVRAFTAAGIIAVVTFLICIGGVEIGKLFGTRLQKHANLLGGGILIGIGLEIFIRGIFFAA